MEAPKYNAKVKNALYPKNCIITKVIYCAPLRVAIVYENKDINISRNCFVPNIEPVK